MPKISRKEPKMPLSIMAMVKLIEATRVDVSSTLAEWICKYTYLNGRPFSFSGYEYLIEVVNDLHPRQYMIKPTQVGATEAITRKIMAFLMKYSLTPFFYWDDEGNEVQKTGVTAICSLASQDDMKNFVKDRIISKIVNASEKIKTALKGSTSEAVDLLGFYESFLYSLSRGSESKVQSIPAEIIAVDEYDQGNFLYRDMLYARLRNAQIIKNKHSKGIFIGYGTPTVPDDTGEMIDGRWHMSDQKEYNVKCRCCNHWQIPKWPESCANYYERNEKRPSNDPYWQCLKCKRPLDFSKIGQWRKEDPLKVHNAEWVAKYPARTKDGGGARGYRIPFATGKNTAANILAQRDTDFKRNKDFWNFALGYAYRDSTMGLVSKDIRRHINKDLTMGYEPGDIYVMGIDQGCYIVIARQKLNSETQYRPRGIWQVVWLEYCHNDHAFSKVKKNKDGKLEIEEGRMSKLIREYNIQCCVIDREPNIASADNLANEWPDVVWRNKSTGRSNERLIVHKKDDFEQTDNILVENKSMVVDTYFDEIRSSQWEYPCDGGERFEDFISHHTAMLKDDSPKRDKKSGISKGDKNHYYYTIGGKPDHFAQAGKFCSQAAEVLEIVRPACKRAGILSISGFKMRAA